MDDAIEFWQTLKITTETTLREILAAIKEERGIDRSLKNQIG